ncbi:ATP-binding cassette subfamily B protein [Pullulanibacillus pueri]|uniref:Multidrug ABC transporter ATP-binding protein n=1 Tax=Pullulanibacillus pueri TaxID=1437324 RepID=A0A8J2ZVB7_9BACL|nr:ABC transporter ATP-binding protein [Pullulanibacillus pueri]MBM7682348.1 ATP-binding cassette subfamily B protein [Pullulanibacillus pueri]GGH80706.1 multidrug ABC transporter ATP-binding protein [Pullulanibacillus pueri]
MLKLAKFLKPYKGLIIAVLFFVFLQSFSNLYLPTLMSDIVDKGIVNQDIPYILRIGAIMLGITVVAVVFSILASFFSAKTATGFGRDVRKTMFSHVETFSLQEFDQIGAASLITRTTNDILQVQQVYVMILRIMIMAPMMCIGGIILAVSKDAMLSLVVIGAMPFLIVAILAVMRKGMPLFKLIQTKLDRMNLVLRERLTGIRVVRAFNRSEFEEGRFQQANRDLAETAIKVNKIMAVLMPIMMLILNFSTIAIIWFGSIRINHGHMQVGDLMAFIQYAMQIMFSLIMLSMIFVMVPRASASAQRIHEVLNVTPSIVERENDGQIKSAKGVLTFDNVTFSYPGAERPALTNISFIARPGQTTAIIGGTGSGKSTLLKLIERFYDIEEGHILLDGKDIQSLSLKDLREHMAYIPQKPAIFTGTIKENIKYSQEALTEDSIRRAASVAQATEFISRLEDGYDTVLTQGGTNLSGGQKQRIAVARALAKESHIYLFDDSFSALDYKTDALVRSALKEEMKEATVIIVAQRVSTIIDADQIIVLDEGKMSGIGNHKTLLQTCDVYKEIVSSQMKGEGIA